MLTKKEQRLRRARAAGLGEDVELVELLALLHAINCCLARSRELFAMRAPLFVLSQFLWAANDLWCLATWCQKFLE